MGRAEELLRERADSQSNIVQAPEPTLADAEGSRFNANASTFDQIIRNRLNSGDPTNFIQDLRTLNQFDAAAAQQILADFPDVFQSIRDGRSERDQAILAEVEGTSTTGFTQVPTDLSNVNPQHVAQLLTSDAPGDREQAQLFLAKFPELQQFADSQQQQRLDFNAGEVPIALPSGADSTDPFGDFREAVLGTNPFNVGRVRPPSTSDRLQARGSVPGSGSGEVLSDGGTRTHTADGRSRPLSGSGSLRDDPSLGGGSTTQIGASPTAGAVQRGTGNALQANAAITQGAASVAGVFGEAATGAQLEGNQELAQVASFLQNREENPLSQAEKDDIAERIRVQQASRGFTGGGTTLAFGEAAAVATAADKRRVETAQFGANFGFQQLQAAGLFDQPSLDIGGLAGTALGERRLAEETFAARRQEEFTDRAFSQLSQTDAFKEGDLGGFAASFGGNVANIGFTNPFEKDPTGGGPIV